MIQQHRKLIILFGLCFSLATCKWTHNQSSEVTGSSNYSGGQRGENSGANCHIPAMTPYNRLNTINALPDPFLSMNGTDIISKSDWTCRRAEISAQAQ